MKDKKYNYLIGSINRTLDNYFNTPQKERIMSQSAHNTIVDIRRQIAMSQLTLEERMKMDERDSLDSYESEGGEQYDYYTIERDYDEGYMNARVPTLKTNRLFNPLYYTQYMMMNDMSDRISTAFHPNAEVREQSGYGTRERQRDAIFDGLKSWNEQMIEDLNGVKRSIDMELGDRKFEAEGFGAEESINPKDYIAISFLDQQGNGHPSTLLNTYDLRFGERGSTYFKALREALDEGVKRGDYEGYKIKKTTSKPLMDADFDYETPYNNEYGYQVWLMGDKFFYGDSDIPVVKKNKYTINEGEPKFADMVSLITTPKKKRTEQPMDGLGSLFGAEGDSEAYVVWKLKGKLPDKDWEVIEVFNDRKDAVNASKNYSYGVFEERMGMEEDNEIVAEGFGAETFESETEPTVSSMLEFIKANKEEYPTGYGERRQPMDYLPNGSYRVQNKGYWFGGKTKVGVGEILHFKGTLRHGIQSIPIYRYKSNGLPYYKGRIDDDKALFNNSLYRENTKRSPMVDEIPQDWVFVKPETFGETGSYPQRFMKHYKEWISNQKNAESFEAKGIDTFNEPFDELKSGSILNKAILLGSLGAGAMIGLKIRK